MREVQQMPLWSVRLDAEIGVEFGEDLDAALREALADCSPAVGAAYLAGRRALSRISAQLAIEAGTLHQAQEDARRKVVTALRELGHRAQIVRMDVMTWEEFEAEVNAGPPELMGVQEIADLLKVSRQRAHQIAARDDFPEPVARLKAGSVWLGATVRRWMPTWERRAGRPKKVGAESA
jgi:hypothetical protein